MEKQRTYEELRQENDKLRAIIRHKEERIAYLERMLFGSRRDKAPAADDPSAPTLFDDFLSKALDEKEKEIEKAREQIAREAAVRRSRKPAKPMTRAEYTYAGLEERRRTVYPSGIDLSQYDIIGKDTTRTLHRDPAKFWVEVTERPILRPKKDRNALHPEILQAPAPNAVIGGNHVGADVLAQIVVDKYVHHLPEYRQVRMLREHGVILPASTVNNWVHATADKLYPLYESLGEDIRRSDYLQVDEVPWRIADRKGKCRHGYSWQFRDARPDPHGLYFYYLKGSREGKIPRAQLLGYKGAIQTDGYRVYDYFENQDGVTLLGCMAHIRRKFIEAERSCPGVASRGLEYIGLLYTLEANLRSRGASSEEVAGERKRTGLPIMDTMEEWMRAASTTATPSDLLGKALDYAYKLWPRMSNYALDGRYHLDNNDCERGQRPSAMGRKNYLFSKDDRGAEDNAVFYSLLESCDVVGVNPLDWLTDVLNRLRPEMEEEEIVQLLPYQYKNPGNNLGIF